MSKFQNDLTGGSVAKQLIRFSLPFLLSNFIQAMYNVADMLIVSWFSGPSSVSGVANGGQITILVVNFVIGITVGGNVLIAQYFGAKKLDELKKTIGTMLSMLIAMALIITVIMMAFSAPVLRLIRIPEESFGEAKNYMNICMTGTLFIFGYNAISAVLRGMGDSRRPLYFVSIACVANVGLDLLFVGGLGMGAGGAAIATVMAQALSLVLSILYLAKNKFVFDFKLKSFRIDKSTAKLLIKIGLPSSIQNVIVGLSFVFMLALVNGFGVFASAATGIVGKYNGFAILPAIAMSASVSSMSAQNIGAGLYDRAKQTMFTGIKIIFPVSAAFFLITLVAPRVILRIFTDSPEVIEQGMQYIRTFSLDYLIVPFTFCCNGLLMGSGHTTFTMFNAMLSSILLRIPLALLFGVVFGWGLVGIGLAAPLASIGALCVSSLYIKSGRWMKSRTHIVRGVADEAAN